MTDINIKETIIDKNTPFNVKRFALKGIGDSFFIKTVDVNNTNKKIISENTDLNNKNVIFEKSKFIKNFQELNGVVQTTNEKRNDFFGRKSWLDQKFTIFHATLKFNPYDHIKKIDEISGFLDYYHSFSKNVIFIPNIVKHRNPYDKETNKSSKRVEIINIRDYIKFVDETYSYLSSMNNRHIFVPISLRFEIPDIEILINHYLKKEWFYMWIDFESSPADISNGNIGGRIRRITNLLRNSSQFDKCIVFATNVRREIISNIKEGNSASSDILATLCGANIVGVDKDIQRVMPKADPTKEKRIIEHKARIFDSETYYYQVKKDAQLNKALNVTSNSAKLAKEFEKQQKEFLNNFELESYLKTKAMINEHSNGKILKSLNIIEKKQNNSNWM